jgi:hypothetical protein
VPLRGGVTITSASKTYVVKDADKSAKSGILPFTTRTEPQPHIFVAAAVSR